jgi:hypothetical protein
MFDFQPKRELAFEHEGVADSRDHNAGAFQPAGLSLA